MFDSTPFVESDRTKEWVSLWREHKIDIFFVEFIPNLTIKHLVLFSSFNRVFIAYLLKIFL